MFHLSKCLDAGGICTLLQPGGVRMAAADARRRFGVAAPGTGSVSSTEYRLPGARPRLADSLPWYINGRLLLPRRTVAALSSARSTVEYALARSANSRGRP